jgi:hypothetical protein
LVAGGGFAFLALRFVFGLGLHRAHGHDHSAVTFQVAADTAVIFKPGINKQLFEFADDVRALATLVHALRTALVAGGLIKGGP